MPRLTKARLKDKIKQIEDYLGPRVDYSTDKWPDDMVDRWIMEYSYELKKRYYGGEGKEGCSPKGGWQRQP